MIIGSPLRQLISDVEVLMQLFARSAIFSRFFTALAGVLVVPVALVAQTGLTEQVSVSSSEAGGNEVSRDAAITADGRFVAFISGATNLVSGDDNVSADLFVRDRQTGTTERIALPAGVTDPTGGHSISADGRFVVFAANGPELDVLNINTHVYLHDRVTGLIEKISTTPANHRGSYAPVISTDARVVAYFSWTDVPFNPDGILDVLVYDRDTGETFAANRSGGEVMSSLWNMDIGVAISGDGHTVAFTFGAALVPGAPGGQVFVHDMTTGETVIASMSSSGTPAGGNFRPAVSADGRFVAFYSGSALVPEDTNGMPDTYVRDLLLATTERVSVDSDENQVPNGSNLADWPAISADGRFVAFASIDPGLTPGDTNGTFDVFVRDRLAGTTTRVSVAGDWSQANDLSFGPSLSADGRTLAFTSAATNLSAEKNPLASLDVYVREEPSFPPSPLLLTAITPSATELWPANNKFVDVTLRYATRGGVGQPVCGVTVTSNELTAAKQGGRNAGDFNVIDEHRVRLKAARKGGGVGRVYTLLVTCIDDVGQAVSGSTQVTVPHDHRPR
jgi:Tol biopolymer transport system component